MASVFQLAGHRRVVVTLWPNSDTHAVDIADDIHATATAATTRGGGGTVHMATRRLRHRWAKSPSLWVPHIPVGAWPKAPGFVATARNVP